MTLTKADLVDQLQAALGLSRKQSVNLVESVFDVLRDTMVQGRNVRISGFGNFLLHDKQSRRGRNPQTGEDLEITARRVLSFRPSPILKAAVNGGLPAGSPSPIVGAAVAQEAPSASGSSGR